MNIKDKEYKDYCRELMALVPVNTEEKAKQYREIWERYHGSNIFTGEEK